MDKKTYYFIGSCIDRNLLFQVDIYIDGYSFDLQMVRYEDFRRKNAYLYDCEAFALQKVKHVYGGVLPESPDNGRIILMRFGK